MSIAAFFVGGGGVYRWCGDMCFALGLGLYCRSCRSSAGARGLLGRRHCRFMVVRTCEQFLSSRVGDL